MNNCFFSFLFPPPSFGARSRQSQCMKIPFDKLWIPDRKIDSVAVSTSLWRPVGTSASRLHHLCMSECSDLPPFDWLSSLSCVSSDCVTSVFQIGGAVYAPLLRNFDFFYHFTPSSEVHCTLLPPMHRIVSTLRFFAAFSDFTPRLMETLGFYQSHLNATTVHYLPPAQSCLGKKAFSLFIKRKPFNSFIPPTAREEKKGKIKRKKSKVHGWEMAAFIPR